MARTLPKGAPLSLKPSALGCERGKAVKITLRRIPEAQGEEEPFPAVPFPGS